jgi:hypothetical protein
VAQSVELSLSESTEPDLGPAPATSVEHWAVAVSEAVEPCLLIDSLSMIVAASASACELLGFEDQSKAVGRHLFAGVVRVIDFADGASLPDSEIEKIPPVLAFSSGRLARGLLRVHVGGETRTLDAIATPLFDGRKPVGSLTFFSSI